MAQSSIAWTNATWNPLAGCDEVSPGCLNCYAATMARRLEAMGQRKYAGTTKKLPNGKVVWTGKINLDHGALAIPLKWKKPKMIFVNSMSDLFHESVPYEFIDKVFAVMNATEFTLPASPNSKPWHIYQVLTKRADRLLDYMVSRSTRNYPFGTHPLFEAGRGDVGSLRGQRDGGHIMNAGAVLSWPPSNVWLGVSVEDQARTYRLGELANTPAAVRFASVEPMLEEVDMRPWLTVLDWVICGCESGAGRRGMDREWAECLARDCRDHGVKFFMKQMDVDGRVSENVHSFPESLQVREYPDVVLPSRV